MPAPLSPEQLAEASKRLDKLTQSLEDSILEDICRRIAKAGAVTDTAEYQLMRLKEMGYANSFIEKAIADYMQKSEAEIRQLFFEAAQVSSDFYEKYYMQNGKAAVPLEDNEYMQQLISAGIEQTKGELNNFTQSMGFAVKQPDGSLKFQPIAKAYQSCLDLAHSQVATGVFDYNTAIRNATAALTGKGLQFVDYASGHRNRADVAVRRAVLTGIGQMAARVAEKAMDDLGTEYVEVTAHAGARPDHAKWQGRIYHWGRKNNAAANTEKVLDNGGGSDIMKMGKVKGAYKQTVPDFSQYAVSDDMPKVNAAKNLIISKLGISENNIDLSEIRNAEVLQPFVEQLVKIKSETGVNISKIKAAEIIDGDDCCISSYKPYEKTLYISSRYFNSNQALTDTLKDWANKGIMPKQCTTIQYIAEHETAHIRIPIEALQQDEAKKIFKNRKLINDNDARITEYYADAVAIFRTSNNADANIIKAVEYLKRMGVSV